MVFHANGGSVQRCIDQPKLALQSTPWIHIDEEFPRRFAGVDDDQERCAGIVECDSIAIQCFQAEEVFAIFRCMKVELLGPDIASRVERPVAALILRQFQLNLSGDFTGQVDLEGDDKILTRPIDRLRVVAVSHGSLAERDAVAYESATYQKSQRSINIHK